MLYQPRWAAVAVPARVIAPVALGARPWALGGIIQLGWYMLWFFLQMLAFGMIAPYAALAGCLTIGCGVTLLGARWPQPELQ